MKSLQWRMHAESKFIHLLIVLVGLFILSPHLEAMRGMASVSSLIFLLALIFTLRALELGRVFFYTCVLVGISAFALESELLFSHSSHLIPAVYLVYAIFMGLSIILILHKIFSAAKVTGDIILGGICLYFLIGYFFACLYAIIFYYDHNAFFISAQWSRMYLFYYSFTTLTTLGYGDVYPVDKTAMVLSSLEAVSGQIYLGIFVARLIGLHIIHHVSKAEAK